jgi:hypothetical protein
MDINERTREALILFEFRENRNVLEESRGPGVRVRTISPSDEVCKGSSGQIVPWKIAAISFYGTTGNRRETSFASGGHLMAFLVGGPGASFCRARWRSSSKVMAFRGRPSSSRVFSSSSW